MAEVAGKMGKLATTVSEDNSVLVTALSSDGRQVVACWLPVERARRFAADVLEAAESAQANSRLLDRVLAPLQSVELAAEQAEIIKRMVESRVRR